MRNFFAFHNARRRDLHSNRYAVLALHNLDDARSYAVEEVLIFVDRHWHESRQTDSDQQVDEYAAFHSAHFINSEQSGIP